MLRLLRRLRRTGAAGNVTVEFALIAVLFLLPLLGASADMVIIISAQAQLNTALQALYAFATTNTSMANNATEAATVVSAINGNSISIYSLSLPGTLTSGAANPSLTYSCYTSGASSPAFSTPSTSESCTSSQNTMTLANYKVTVTVSLPIPVPGLASPMTLSAEGAIPISYK